MCTLILLRRLDHDWPLIAASNRDEMLTRAWRPPGRHWPDRPEVVAGFDDAAKGSWLGVNDHGVVAAILNRVGSLGPQPGKRSRGELVLEALDHADAMAAAAAMSDLNPAAYRSFNLVIADNRDAFWLALRNETGGGVIDVQPLPPGLSMITAHDRNDRSSARIRQFLPLFESAKAPRPEVGDWEDWKAILASRSCQPANDPGSAMAIVTARGFGTSSSSLIALPAAGQDLEPIWLFSTGCPGDSPYHRMDLTKGDDAAVI